ncbi:type II toxin-antitoxin system death-on-curing family toxin [Helicobacter saguini]|uniref:Type II toxin-antitoxin system death-on-curing family toxin n=1 Tax=Helicobacter saguini TaxID=1548018 RepID=A0A347VTM2_9HELI|nr:type II toxin-antitoxin system death-on-curing family toxin [Helicobacter saguini]MWV62040.1 type II toxin-antitoxin system death-on-curing family toxin [Helicobacter saguini]MWV67287.1 type II toxin-antitoxin system death-on-curing family toxin [Helicobacter saguini]MWV69640.1 type II toxin-antitoxin system death-on-curing family toxin [Helicobacter saguini]MWV70809.1 type II toxin-antitoxin system death-on-curing family toxin [Helicobacter saguini]TLD94350.1 type II toxin-antitoxin system
MIYIHISEAINAHDEIIATIGGLKGYHKESIGYLESALEQAQIDTFYPTFLDKLTHIVFACVKFHPFIDGNKRTAIFLGMSFLEANGKYKEDFALILENVVVDLASDKIGKNELREILEKFLNE